MTNCCAEINKIKSMRHIVSQQLHYHREFPTKLWQNCFPIVVKAQDFIHDFTCVNFSFKYNLFPSCWVNKKIRYVFFQNNFHNLIKAFALCLHCLLYHFTEYLLIKFTENNITERSVLFSSLQLYMQIA